MLKQDESGKRLIEKITVAGYMWKNLKKAATSYLKHDAPERTFAMLKRRMDANIIASIVALTVGIILMTSASVSSLSLFGSFIGSGISVLAPIVVFFTAMARATTWIAAKEDV